MLVMVVFFIAFRWLHLSTPLIRLFLLVLILLLMPTLNFLPVWFALSLLRFRLPSRLPMMFIFFISSRRRHTRCRRDWSSDVCSSDLFFGFQTLIALEARYLARKAPVVRVAPAQLRDFSISRSPGRKLSYFGYEFEVPWNDVDEAKSEIGRASCRERV